MILIQSNGNSYTLLLGANTGKATLENNLTLSCKLNKHTLYNPAVLLLESPVQVHLEIHFRMFTAALFVITGKLETKQTPMDGRKK